ncbi:hypothetical protein ADL01_17505 [Streptomyces sp. NRRL WC-3618]|uniref:DUF4760 domain-containing protein n=1 Tax=Streptomyces sp. NRRL WC-3618 TaxID=1519490 RepID=UPI0006B01DC4|nr:hypothetical protein [Streptomyces sp. NRRL WC-3618]KOV74985.1 hypothetical protein ADL01_17505 [Streptomyces sp. NRRL WC-3618]
MTSSIFNTLALVFSLIALVISLHSARREAKDARRANLLLFVGEFGRRARSPEFKEAQLYIDTSMAQHNPALGISRLPDPAREHVQLVGGFYSDLGALVVGGVIDEERAVSMHYTGIKDTWRALEPFVKQERNILRARDAGGFWISFEHLAAYTEKVPYSVLAKKFPRRHVERD